MDFIGNPGRLFDYFGAGMSGGIAYVLDEDGDFAVRCNREMVDLEPLSNEEDVGLVRGLLERHREYTGSTVAERLLEEWEATVSRFVKVMPLDYRRVLEEQRSAEKDQQKELGVING